MLKQTVDCSTQGQADKALAAGHNVRLIAGSFYLVVAGVLAPDIVVNADVSVTIVARGSSQPRIVAWGSSQPRIVAWGSSQPRIEARESSQPRIEAWESSQPRIVARESSQPRIVARESSQPRIEAWESSQPRIVARESSQPRIEAWGSSQPRIEAWESSQPRIVARGSSQPRIEARGYVQASLKGAVVGTASKSVSVLIDGSGAGNGTLHPKIKGGIQTIIKINTPADWCEYYGVQVKRGVAILYKAVGDNFRSPRGGDYTPGTKPMAPDWDGGARECGGGFHYSPSPAMAREFNPDATRYVACPVKLADLAIHWNGQYPQKCKGAGVTGGKCFEVDEDGEPVEVKS